MTKRKCLSICVIVFLVLIVSSATASCATDQWAMFHHDASHSGVADKVDSQFYPKLLWNYSTGAAVVSSPAVSDGLVFVGSKDYSIYCLNSSNGRLVWNFTTGNEVISSPAIYKGYVYVGSSDGWFYCLDIATGLPVWASVVEGQVQSSPVVTDGRAYIGSGKHGFYCFNASDGSLLWRYWVDCPVNSSPAIKDGGVYFAASNYYIYALNASNGNEIWRQHTGSQSDSPSVADGCVYTGSYDGYVCALGASTGTMIWRFQTQGVVSSTPATLNGCLYVGSEDNNVYCLNASNGHKIWQYTTGYWVKSSIAINHDRLYVGAEDYNIYCLDANSGIKLWSYPTGNYVDSSPAVFNGTLYVGSSDGYLYAFDISNPAAQAPAEQPTDIPLQATVLFDTLAGVVAAVTIFGAIRFYKAERGSTAHVQAPIAIVEVKPWWIRHQEALCIAVLLAISSVFYVNLGNSPLWASDEQIYTQWAFHMTKSGDYLTPWAFGGIATWIGKPPLFMWFISLAYQIFGATNFAARIPSAIFASLSLVLIYHLGKELYNRHVGFAAALVLASLSTFYVYARHAMTDVTFVFFFAASIYFFVLSEKAEKNLRYTILSGVFFGLALLTKQVAALLIPLTLLVYLVASKRNIRHIFTKRFAIFLALGLLIFSPYIIFLFLSFPSEFWQWFVVYSGVTRVTTPIEGHAASYLYYFDYLATTEFWTLLLPFAAGLCLYKSVFKRAKADMLIVAWIVIVLGVFTFAQTKLEWYILPVFPAFAIGIGSFLYEVARFAWLKIKFSLKN